MIAARFAPLDIECLVTTAVELWEDIDPDDLSGHQRDILDRARVAMLAEHAGRQPSFPEVVTFIGPRPAGRAWVLRRHSRHEDEVSLHVDEDCARAELAKYARGVWDNVVGDEGIPDRPPADDRDVVRLYYGPDRDGRPDEGYSLHPEKIIGRGRTRIVALDHRFPDEDACEQANRDAIFHPQTDADGLPCVEIDGVLVFAYLDHEAGAVRVSVHLDSAQDRLLRPDGSVPLRVEVEDDLVLDTGTGGASERGLLAELLDAADDLQEQAIREAAIAAGVLWRCPTCRWDNPAQASRCEGPGACRVPKPRKTG
ncbi:hypothetical protein OG948_60425 (plasmid) [Embleya sp. NBC_00888]|uniref:hypothetical protein n=1 Tax=Embleya sp. NBC_00888 TaxID=2975960 RepID=UPI002F917943|nr:hypothetical protein OG948_60425 [Embleya sp. NBC_00888]